MLLARDVLPDVELGPVRDREHAEVLAGALAAVIAYSRARAAGSSDPIGRSASRMREDALLGARLFFVAAGAADARVEARARRSRRAASPSAARCGSAYAPVSSLHAAAIDRVLHRAHDQLAGQARARTGRGSRASPGSCGRCRCAAAERALAPGQNALRASAARRRSSPCRRKTAARGRSNCAATSRRTWMASFSRADKCVARRLLIKATTIACAG